MIDLTFQFLVDIFSFIAFVVSILSIVCPISLFIRLRAIRKHDKAKIHPPFKGENTK